MNKINFNIRYYLTLDIHYINIYVIMFCAHQARNLSLE